jgi:hypothetical protein
MKTFSFPSVLLFVSALLPALAGCGGSGGALGNASVSQGCAGSTLPCQSASDFNAPLAVGASVTVSVDLMLQGGGQPPLELTSTDPQVFTVAQQTLTGVGPGLATLLFTSQKSVVVDFIAVWVQAPSAIAVSLVSNGASAGEIQGDVGLLVGDRVGVAVSPLSMTQALVGTAPATWSVADPTIVSVLDEGIVGRATVVGRAAGKTTVTASALGFQQPFTVEVTP